MAAEKQEHSMATDQHGAEFQLGWDAAIRAAHDWHEARAKQTMILARRSRFPKNLEREAEVHKQSAGMMLTLSPDDV
jgi:hypothetical protein